MRRIRSLVPALAVLLTIPTLFAVAPTTSADHLNQVPCLLVKCMDLTVDAARFRPRIVTEHFAAWDCNVQEGATVPGTRTLLRFTFTTPNVGDADLVIGSPSMNPVWFEFGDCHGHYHFKEYADYRLWTPAQFAEWNALREADPDVQAHVILEARPDLQPIRGDKRGFCVIDVVPYDVTAAPKWISCDLQGISVGWADEYYWALDGQFIDVTGLPSGAYVLEAEVNAEHFYAEKSYANNRAWRNVTL